MCSQKFFSKCMSPLGPKNIFMWDGPKLCIWWNQELWALVLVLKICHSKVFKLNARPIDDAKAKRSHSGKGSGWCCWIRRLSKSCLKSHDTRLVFCLYVKRFLPSIFSSINTWGSMASNFLITEISGGHKINQMEVFIQGRVQVLSFCPPKRWKPTEQAFRCTWNLHDLFWNSGTLDNSEFSNNFLKGVLAENFATGKEKCTILKRLADKDVETLMTLAAPNSRAFRARWKYLALLLLRIPTQDYSSLCSAKGRNS